MIPLIYMFCAFSVNDLVEDVLDIDLVDAPSYDEDTYEYDYDYSYGSDRPQELVSHDEKIMYDDNVAYNAMEALYESYDMLVNVEIALAYIENDIEDTKERILFTLVKNAVI